MTQPKRPEKPIDYYFNVEPQDWGLELFFREIEQENPQLFDLPYYSGLRKSFREKTDRAERMPLIDLENAMGPRYKPVVLETPPPQMFPAHTQLAVMYLSGSPLSPVIELDKISRREGWSLLGNTEAFIAVKFEPVNRFRRAYNRLVVTEQGKYVEKLTNFYILRFNPLIIARWFDPTNSYWEVTNYETGEVGYFDTTGADVPVPFQYAFRSTLQSVSQFAKMITPFVRNGFVWNAEEAPELVDILRERKIQGALSEFYEIQQKYTMPLTEEHLEKIAEKHSITILELSDAIATRIANRKHKKTIETLAKESQHTFKEHFSTLAPLLKPQDAPMWIKFLSNTYTQEEYDSYVRWVEENMRVPRLDPLLGTPLPELETKDEPVESKPKEEPEGIKVEVDVHDVEIKDEDEEPASPVKDNFSELSEKQKKKLEKKNQKALKRANKKAAKKEKKGK